MSTLKVNDIKSVDGTPFDFSGFEVTSSTGTQTNAAALGDRWISKYTTNELAAASTLKAGDKVRTPGYYAAGDGGGNDFIVEERDGSAEDDGSVIFIAGTSLQVRGLFPGTSCPEQFGAALSGASDESSFIQRWFNYLDGSDAIFTEGNTYRIDETITGIKAGQTIKCAGAIVDASNLTSAQVKNDFEGVFEAEGSLIVTTTLSVAGSKNDISISVSDASLIQSGDCLYMESSGEHWYTQSGNAITKRFLNKIYTVSGSSLGLELPLPFAFDISSNTVTVEVWRPIKNVTVTGGEFVGGGERFTPADNGVGTCVVKTKYSENSLVGGNGMRIKGFQGVAVRGDYAYSPIARDIYIQGHDDNVLLSDITEGQNSGFYGVFYNKALFPKYINLTGFKTRHLQDAGNSWHGFVDGCEAIENHRPGLGTHGGCSEFEYTDENRVFGGTGGIQLRCHNVTIGAVKIDCSLNDSSGIYDATGASIDIPKTINIKNPDIFSNRNGISLNGNIAKANIIGGSIKVVNSTYRPIYISTLDLGDAVIANLGMNAAGGENCVFAPNNAPRSRGRIMLKECSGKSYAGALVRVYGVAGGTETVLIAKDNFIDASLGATNHVLAADAALVVSTPNYLPNGTVY